MLNRDYSILIAKCGKTIGLNGALKIIIYTDFKEVLKDGVRVYCDGNILTINKFEANKMTIQFKEINSIDSAKPLSSKLLYMSEEETKKYCHTKPNEYLWFEIIGCNVFDNEVLVGNVINITRMGNVDYLIVKADKKLLINLNIKLDSFMIPYIARYIINTDIKTKIITTIDTIGILENS